jgi:hypothetical protein
MIETLLILNKLGLLRFIKVYSEEEHKLDKEALVITVFSHLQNSRDTSIIFDFNYMGQKRKLIYRLFGSIYIVMILDDLENELAMLDFINVMMQVFDDVFKGVCELHLIMNPEKVYLVVDEMISGGSVIETSRLEISSNYMDKMRDEENYKFFANK